MKSFIAFAAVSSLAGALAQATINSPVLVQCQPTAIQFSGGVAPYFLRVLPGGQPTATPIEFLPNQAAAGTYTWTVNLPAGTTVTLAIIDSSGLPNYSSPLTIQTSPDSSCLNGSTVASATAVPTATGAAASSSAAAGTLVTSGTAATVTAATGTPTGTIGNNITASNYNFTCAAGQGLVTYGIAIAELDGVSLAQATRYFGNWTAASPGGLVNSTGRGVGARRAYSLGTNATVQETLRLNNTNRTTGALQQQWNFTNPIPVQLSPSLTVYNAFDDLTVYTNETSMTTSVQYFILACFNDQVAGLTTLASFIEQSLTFWAGSITNATAAGPAGPASPPALRRIVRLF